MNRERMNKVTSIRSNQYLEDSVKQEEQVKRKKRIKLGIRLAVFCVFVALVAIPMTTMITSQQAMIDKKQEKKAMLQDKLASLQSEAHELRGKVEKLHNLEYIGKIARRDYYMTKEGDIVFITEKSQESSKDEN